MEEEWRPIRLYGGIDYEGEYEVSNFGNLRSRKHGKIKSLKPHTNYDGYVTTVFSKGGKTRHIKIHRLVAVCFLPEEEGKPMVNHVDGNKSNNRVTNLVWVSQSENSSHFHVLKGDKAPIETLLKRIKNIDKRLEALQVEKQELLKRVDDRLI